MSDHTLDASSNSGALRPRGDLPEMTSSSSMSFSPSLKSSSMFSICVPAFRRWELHHAVNVCKGTQKQDTNGVLLSSGAWALSVFPSFTIINCFELKLKEKMKFNGQEGVFRELR